MPFGASLAGALRWSDEAEQKGTNMIKLEKEEFRKIIDAKEEGNGSHRGMLLVLDNKNLNALWEMLTKAPESEFDSDDTLDDLLEEVNDLILENS